MKKLIFVIGFSALTLAPPAAQAQSRERSVAGAASGSLPAATIIGGVAVSTIDLGTGVHIDADGSAAGWFHAVLNTSAAGPTKGLTVEVKITQGSVSADGTVSFSGSGTIDLGDGASAAPIGLLTVTIGDSGLVVAIDATTLPVAVNGGTVGVE